MRERVSSAHKFFSARSNKCTRRISVEMAMALVSRGSCSNLEMSNPSIPSSAQSNSFPQPDGLWCDIDLAERYLVSSQFDKAATLGLTVLQQLKYVWECSEHRRYGGIDEDEIKDIIEAAGMVVIQAYSESNRFQMIFNDLETIFGSLAKVPSSVFLAGLCLQVSAKLYSDAQLSIESFLKHWDFTALNECSCEFKPKLDQRNILSLSPDKYIKVAELYCVQVLSKGLGRLDLALQWVREADIPADTKQDILKELDKEFVSVHSKDKRDLGSHIQKVLSSNADSAVGFARPQVEDRLGSEIETRSSKKPVEDLDSRSSLKNVFLFSPLIDMVSGWTDQSLAYKMNYGSIWNKISTIVYHRKVPFSGAAAVFITIAIYRQRFRLSRALGGLGKGVQRLLRTIFMSLFDFWQLAFNVQLNPLAAVQPFPPAHQLR